MTGANPSDVTITPAQNLPSILALDYDHFVECAFITILNRPADTDALEHYVERLKAGHPKLAILSALYKSEEARRASVRIPWMRSAIWRYRLSSIPLVRLAFVSDKRDIRLEFEHRLHAVEKKVAQLTANDARLSREVAELSTAMRHAAKLPEIRGQQNSNSTNPDDEMSGAPVVTARVYRALSDALVDEANDVFSSK